MPGNNRPPPTQKLRNSCDSCNIAKVKCSKASPSCYRCQAQGTQCIYGVSMRAGKHRANGSNIQKPPPAEPSLRTKSSTEQPSPTQTLSSEESNKSVDPLSSLMDTMPLSIDWSSILSGDRSPILMGDPMDLTNNQLQDQQPLSIRESDFTPPTSVPCSMGPTHTVPRDPFAAEPQMFSNSPRTNGFPPGIFTDPEPLPSNINHSDPCQCSQKILQELLALNQNSDVPAAFDTALNQNKHIITLCHGILHDQTHHHHDISFGLTLTALIAKVIAVYDIIYNPCRRHNSAGSFSDIDRKSRSIDLGQPMTANSTHHNSPFQSDRSSPFPPSTPQSGWSTPQSAANPVRLTLGSFRLDEKDEEKLRWDIFKIELSKVGALVQSFEQRFCDTGPLHDQLSKYEAKAYEDMVDYLQKRLRVSLETPGVAIGSCK